jgi:hypothetical protein
MFDHRPIDTGFDTAPVTATVSPAPDPAPATVESGLGDLSGTPAPAQRAAPTVNTAADAGEDDPDIDLDARVAGLLGNRPATDWNAISAFMRAVVPWPGSEQDPGYVNLHYSFPNPDPDPAKVKKKPKLWAGWPYKEIDKFNGGLKWTLDHPDRAPAVYFCTSLQEKKGLSKKGKDKAQRLAKDALAFKSIWIDCDVRPDDKTGKHYLTEAEALKALLAFIAKAKLPPPTIINSGGGFHLYWISNKVLTPAEWYPYASGLKHLLIQEGVKCDTGLTTDYVGRHPARPSNQAG